VARPQRFLLIALLIALGAHGLAAQIPGVRVTYLYDNTVATPHVKPDWGFACLVEGHGRKVLFDTGANDGVLRGNLAALNVDLSRLHALVLSHDHGDHTNGLVALGKRPALPAYYAEGSNQQVVNRIAESGMRAVPVTRSLEIFPGFRVSDRMVFTQQPVVSAAGGNAATTSPPEIVEVALAVDTRDGLVVIVGCAHPGIVPMLRQIRQTTNRPIHMVLGGFHLLQTPADQVRQIIADFRSIGVAYAGPTHCTGDEAIRLFREAYGDHFIKGGVGTVVEAPVTGGMSGLSRPTGPSGVTIRPLLSP